MDIFFLEATVPLTKSYARSSAGIITKTPYPFVWEFTSHSVPCTSLAAFHTELVRHANLGHCLLKGSIAKPLVNESRAGSTDSNAHTEFIVLDLDGLPDVYSYMDKDEVEHKIAVTVDVLLKKLGLEQTSYIIQWSASYGIENTKLRAHLIFMLDKPMAAPLLKQWLIQLNHEIDMLNAAMTLTKTGNSISWALDISACQNDKLIYIAPPVLKGIKDPMGKTPRISLEVRKHEKLSLTGVINSTAKNKELTGKRLEALREVAGLPKRKTTYKMHGSMEVMVKPDSCVITEMKTERGFTYFNLNGGDSWAYYHPENNPDYIHNFKGEPSYLTKELLPDYWDQLTSAGTRANSAGVTYLAFCDRATGAYWRGTYSAPNDMLELYLAKNETQIRHFAKQYGLPLGDFIPEWDLVFDPHDQVRVDVNNRIVNTFQLTDYMKATIKPVKVVPKTIMKVISHALGGDPVVIEHWMNWIAFILQYRDRTKTAWVLHGVPGTGKGILFNKILRPIFGMTQTSVQNMETLAEPYNHWMQRCFLVLIDEVQTKALMHAEKGVIAKLKNYITEAFVQIRAMYAGSREAPNFCNFMLASNMTDVLTIEGNDRRINVAGYQAEKIVISDKEIEQIEKELQAFHDYLATYPVDTNKACTILQTADRSTMISISESSVDTVGNAILKGDFNFLMEQLPSSTTQLDKLDRLELNKTEEFRDVLKALLDRTDRNNGTCNIARDELRVIFDYVVGGMPSTPNKFTSLLKHHRIHMSYVWINSSTERGIKTTWIDLAKWPTYQKQFIPAPVTPTMSALAQQFAAQKKLKVVP